MVVYDTRGERCGGDSAGGDFEGEEEKTSGCGETSGRKVEMENRQQQTREVHEKSCFLHPPRVLHQGLHRDANDATDLVILWHTNDEMK